MVAKLPNEPLVTVRIWLLRIRFKLALTYLLSRGRLYTFTPYLTKSLVRKGWVEDMEFSLIPSEFIQFWSQSNRWIRFEVREVLNLSFSRASIPFITISFLNGKLKIFDISSKRTNKMWSEMCPIFIAVESASLRRVPCDIKDLLCCWEIEWRSSQISFPDGNFDHKFNPLEIEAGSLNQNEEHPLFIKLSKNTAMSVWSWIFLLHC